MALVAGEIVAQSYDVALGSGGVTFGHTMLEGLSIPVGGGAVLMLLPAIAARLVPGLIRDPWTATCSGSSGATAFTAAAILTRLSPQLATGGVHA